MFGGMVGLSEAGVGCSMGAFEAPGDGRSAYASGCGRLLGVSWCQAGLRKVCVGVGGASLHSTSS